MDNFGGIGSPCLTPPNTEFSSYTRLSVCTLAVAQVKLPSRIVTYILFKATALVALNIVS